MKKTIYVKYYSELNLGDDLFILAIGEMLKDVNIKVFANPKYFNKIKQLPKNVKLFKTPSYVSTILNYLILSKHENKFLNKINDKILKINFKESNAFVYIVGSTFMENPSSKNDFLNYKINKFLYSNVNDIELNLNLERPYFIIGANIGPIYTYNYLRNVKSILENTTATMLRDKFSYQLVSELKNVSYAPDVVFSLANHPFFSKNVVNNTEKHIVISVIDPYNKPELKSKADSYIDLIVKTIVFFSSLNAEISLVSFCDKEGDLEAINIIKKKVIYRKINVVHYNGNFEKIINIFKTADYVISSRFHSMILSLMLDKPFFPIVYGLKVKNYLEDIDFKGMYATCENINKITIDDILYNYKEHIITDVSYHKENAKSQFTPLKKFLKINK